jgi:hypothetical protein
MIFPQKCTFYELNHLLVACLNAEESIQLYNYYSNKMRPFFIIKSIRYYNLSFFVLYFCPYMFQPAWVIFRGLNASAWLKLLLITIY